MTTTTTVTKEYDEKGRLVKEITVITQHDNYYYSQPYPVSPPNPYPPYVTNGTGSVIDYAIRDVANRLQ